MHSCTFHAKKGQTRERKIKQSQAKKMEKPTKCVVAFGIFEAVSHLFSKQFPRQVDVVTFAAEKDSWPNALLVAVLRCVITFSGR